MTEYDILYLHNELVGRTWTILQWWAGISFGVIALSHLAAKKLNLILLITTIFLYVSITAFCFGLLQILLGIEESMFIVLSSLNSSGELSIVGQTTILGTGSVIAILGLISQVGTFMGCLTYLIYSYKKTHMKT